MSSSQSGEPRLRLNRVIKSGTEVAAKFAFPNWEQVTARDLPPSLSDELQPAPVREPELQTPPHPQAGARPPHGAGEAAAEAEARARALERRAAHVLEEAEDAAARRVAEAEEHAAGLLAAADAEAEAIRAGAREAGRAEGLTEGRSAGLEAGRAEAEALVAAAQQEADVILAEAQAAALSIREGAFADRSRLLDASEEQLLDLAFAMARQILRAELSLNPTAVLPMMEVALAKLKGEEEPQVRVSPATQQLLEEHRGRLLAALPGARRLTVEGDPALADGDFLVQGDQGFIDGRLESQFGVLRTEVKAEER